MLAMIMSFMPTTAYAGGVADGSDAAVTNSTLKVQESVIAYAGMEWNLIGSNMEGVKAPTGALTLLNKNYEDDFPATLYRDWALSEDEGFKKSGSFSGTVYGYAYKLPFNTYANEYKGSKLHNTLEAATENIPNEEKYLAIPRNLIAVDVFSSQGDMIGDGVPNQIYWPLSARELADVKNNSVMDPYNHNGSHVNTADHNDRGWWLRSGPIDGTSTGSGACAYFGTVYSEYWQEALSPYTDIAMYPVLIYARPAMYLNIKDAVFLSSVADGKSDAVGTISQVGDTDGTLKFTMKSSNQSLQAKLKGKTDDAYIINYSNATTGENQYISCVLTDKSGAVKYYGKLKAAADKKDAQGSVMLPKMIDGQNIANYTVKIFDEKIKAGNYTDFCSAPIVFNLKDAKPILTDADLISVHNQSITINGGVGTKENPNTGSVDIDKAINQIAVKDLVVSNGANAKIYEDETFAVDQVGIMLKDGENHLYVKVTAGDSITTKYYNITINRESTPTPPPKPSGGNNYMVIMENDGHGSASASIDDQKRVTLTATPHDGYRFDKWEVVTGDITIADNSFTMPERNVTVKAHFKAIPVPPGSGERL